MKYLKIKIQREIIFNKMTKLLHLINYKIFSQSY